MSNRKTFETNSSIKTRQRFRILKRTPNSDVVGVKTRDGKRKLKFDPQSNSAFTDDPGLAREIHASSGQGGDNWDVLVVPLEKKQEPGHVRTITIPPMPWHDEDHKFGQSSKE